MTDLYIDEAARVMALATLKRIFVERGCTRLYYKRLAANDNSKNQIYLGGSPEDTRAIPTGHWTRIRGESKKGAPTGERYILQAPVDLHWMKPDGGISPAKQTKMILYPQYGAAGEFRLSGFLDGAVDRPSTLLQHTRRGREPGRILFFGTDNEKKVFCFLAPADARSAREISTEQPIETVGLLTGLSLPAAAPQVATREALLTVLGTVNRQGWTESKILHSRNGVRPCKGPQGIGQTLLAELKVPADGRAVPDYRGWEVKAYTVKSFASTASCRVTLMTPEPTGGYYREHGISAFLARYGSPSAGDPQKLYFQGQHRIGVRNAKRKTLLTVHGYDRTGRKITDVTGGIRLLDDKNSVAAEWGYERLIEHWRNKHARAVFVPSLSDKGPPQRYWYSPRVHLATGNPFANFMEALLAGLIIYDPGVRLGKPRSQFRIMVPRCLTAVYENVELRADVI